MRWIRLLNTVATLLLLPGLFPSDHDGLEPMAVEAGTVVISAAGVSSTSCQYCIGVTEDDVMVFVDGNGEKTWLQVDSLKAEIDSTGVSADDGAIGEMLDNLRNQIEMLQQTLQNCREALPLSKAIQPMSSLFGPFRLK